MKNKALSTFVVLSLLVGLFAFGAPAAMAEGVEYVACGEETVVTLWAGQTIDAGTVTVANDEDYLYVTFSTANNWLLSETHLHVADSLASIPQTKKGNPKIGNFDYQQSHNPLVTEYTYTIPKDALNLEKALVIAAHATVVQLDDFGSVIASETGWGDGDRFVDKGSWATYFQYIWQDCNGNEDPPPGTETAFAYGGGTNAADVDTTTCFLNIDEGSDGNGDFNRWGWTNGPLAEGSYSFDIYAGAGQCDISKGTFVGTLDVEYSNGTAVVTFQMTETDASTTLPYTMAETHLYVGNEILARNNGEFTVAPGQYPTIHDLDGATSDFYTIDALSGDIYVVAHATVAGFPVE